MVFREFLAIAAANLWRLKLRSILTATGVVIGIAALVTMLSFAFGVQRNVAERFRALGLFHTLHVMPPMVAEPGEASDSTAAQDGPAARLDAVMVAHLAELDGVSLVYPQDSFDAQLEWGAEKLSITAQSLPAAFVASRELGRLVAGEFFASDTLPVAVLRPRTVERLGAEPDSIIGQTVLLRVASRGQMLRLVLEQFLARLELAPELITLARQMSGAFLGPAEPSELRLRVCGVAELESGWGFRLRDLLVPAGVVADIDRISFSDPFELMSQLTTSSDAGYSLAIVTLREDADHTAVRDAIEDLGLRTFSFVEQFEEMRRHFLLFDLMMSVIGLIALLVASLGIVNTMVMSITERTREIGILKSLGAEDRQIRLLFLLESGLIGLGGALVGLLLGWGLSRVGSLILREIMAAQDAPRVDLFHLPLLVALGAVVFGVLISLLAGVHPAARAARTDPVHALRHG
jgi:putative ABC transport system permease protein